MLQQRSYCTSTPEEGSIRNFERAKLRFLSVSILIFFISSQNLIETLHTFWKDNAFSQLAELFQTETVRLKYNKICWLGYFSIGGAVFEGNILTIVIVILLLLESIQVLHIYLTESLYFVYFLCHFSLYLHTLYIMFMVPNYTAWS